MSSMENKRWQWYHCSSLTTSNDFHTCMSFMLELDEIVSILLMKLKQSLECERGKAVKRWSVMFNVIKTKQSNPIFLMKIFDSNTSSAWNYTENHLENESSLNILVLKKEYTRKWGFILEKEMAARSKFVFFFQL